MTRDDARAHWAKSGLTYAVLNAENVERLRALINRSMKDSGLIRGSFRAPRPCTVKATAWGMTADIRCNGFYFTRRQAATFEPGGFIGFAGWADETNVQPILAAFVAWVDEIAAAGHGAARKEGAAA
jgi:hypothetical protein